MQWLINKIVGTKHQRDLRKLRPLVVRINALEQEYQALAEAQVQAKTAEFKGSIAESHCK